MSDERPRLGRAKRHGPHDRPLISTEDAAAFSDGQAIAGYELPESADDLEIPGGNLGDIRRFQESAWAENTRRGYVGDWKAFSAWCETLGQPALPAEPLLVAAYLSQAANLVDEDGSWFYAPGTLKRWVASINKAHAVAGHAKPGQHPDVQATLQGIVREHARVPDRRSPLLLDELKRVLTEIDINSWPYGVIGHRDSAVLVMGFAGAYRRSELAEMRIGDVMRHSDDGLHVLMRKSKTDQEGEGRVKGLPYGSNPMTCPPCAFLRWVRVLAAAEHGRPHVMKVLREASAYRHICRGPAPEVLELDLDMPLFRPVMKNGAIKSRGMSGAVVHSIVTRRVGWVGLDASAFGAHSLRAGFITQAFRNGANHHEVMRQSWHKSVETVEIYSREGDPLRHNSVTRLGL